MPRPARHLLLSALTLGVLLWPSALRAQVAPRIVIAMDTSGSMAQDLNGLLTYGDGVTTGCSARTSPNGRTFSCGTNCTAGLDTDCDGLPNDSRIFIAKEAVRNMVLGFGDVDWALARFGQTQGHDIYCPSVNGSECNLVVTSYGNPQCNTSYTIPDSTYCPIDAFVSPIPDVCEPGRSNNLPLREFATGSPQVCVNYQGGCAPGDLLVGFSDMGAFSGLNNTYAITSWLDNAETNFINTTSAGNFCNAATGGDCELRPGGATPLAGLLDEVESYITPVRAADARRDCRPYAVILLTDGEESCGGDPSGVAARLRGNGILTYVVGISITSGSRAPLNAIAQAGGTDAGAPGGDYAYFADDPVTLSAGLSDIVRRSLLVEVCNEADDDCDGLIDEGVTNACGTCGPPPAETCNGADDDCDGAVDEGVANACGTCGPPPTETCNRVDDDCDGIIDEDGMGGDVCAGCHPSAEVCDGLDNDCDGVVDEDLSRACGSNLGACSAGTQTCAAGSWGACVGAVGPSPEVCNGIDDDCDGAVDGFSEVCGDGTGACAPGMRVCTAGSWGACTGAVGPSPERCDAVDNDCDGSIDEGDPGGGAACGDDTGECVGGTLRCVSGALVCEGGVGPSAEICNGLDDDCDGVIDDGIPVGAACGSNVGECVPGVNLCREGGLVCDGAIGPEDEACDNLDNDCDGAVDEGLGLGEACGSDEGVCMPGVQRCVDGRVVCEGEVGAGRESCDCEDDDCDGIIDEEPETGALCPSGSACVACGCALPCTESEFGFTCPTGRTPQVDDAGQCYCVEPRCDDAACASETIEQDGVLRCAPESDEVSACVCKNNACSFPCDGVVCRDGMVCDPRDPNGRCVEDSCRGLGCPSGQICDTASGECASDRCAEVSCGDEACRDGVCEPSCAGVECGAEQVCARGVCQPDPCAGLTCGAGEVCDPAEGRCVADRCGSMRCLEGERCEPVSGECVADPCATLRCPEGQRCQAGECALPVPEVPDAGAGFDAGVKARDRVLASGGFGCSVGAPSGSSSAAWFLGLALFACVVVRRRRASAHGIALLVGAGALASGCEVDPFCLDCEEVVVDGGPADAGRRDAGPSDAGRPDASDAGRDAGPDGCVADAVEVCNERDDDCDGLIDEGIDPRTDEENCGGCGVVCAPVGAFGECVDGRCEIASCDVGRYDLDEDPATGCEYRCLPDSESDAVCDLRDNDCDGAVDEDVDTANDPEHCGVCGRVCRFSHAGASCAAGACVLGACDDGWHDLDGVPDNGCEYGCTPDGSEVCNGRDDDCDGVVDEGDPGGGGSCGSDVGACVAGVLQCVGGAVQCIGASGPALETCNGVDDDCDGDTDEDFDLQGDLRHCGSCGNACALPNAIAACVGGGCELVACDAGWVDRDPAAPGCEFRCDFAGAEICNGRDDDCDGVTDEGLSPPDNFCNPNGICAGTAATCAGSGGWKCSYPSAYEPSEVSCDGLDNDCDGAVDEAFPSVGSSCSNGSGACRRTGVIACTGDGSGTACTAPPAGTPAAFESCNDLDDDCDGVIDEEIPLSAIPTVRMSSPSGGVFEVMVYEASRPDATSSAQGNVGTHACSNPGVLPWTNLTWDEAQAACCALNPSGTCEGDGSGWRLCDALDWQTACRGPSASCEWSYDTSCNASSPLTCNGQETDSDPAAPGDQNALHPTGSAAFGGCYTDWGGAGVVYDLSGNVKEWTSTSAGPGIHEIRGGSYNNVEAGRTCHFDFTLGDANFAFPNTGFRCCHY